MNCEQAGRLLADRLKQLLNDDEERGLDAHLESCPACRDEAAAITMLWDEMSDSEAPVPSARMRSRFHASVAAYENRTREAWPSRWLEWLHPGSALLQAGMAVSFIVVGIFIGRGLSDSSTEIDELRQEVRAMSVALLDHQSATERLTGVAWSARNASGAQVANALLDVLRNDRNVNVRLAAVEALGAWADQPDVADALVDALVMEQAPLLQVALLELLLERNVGNATVAARQLLESGNLDPTVSEFVRASLRDIENRADGDTA